MKILAIHLYHFMDYARVRGTAWQDMLMVMKDPPEDFLQEQTMVTEQDLYAVLKFIDDRLDDKSWGISCAHFISLKLLGLIYRISLQVTTIQEALHYLQSYLLAAMPIVEADTIIKEEAVSVKFSINNTSPGNRILLEYTLAVVGRELRMMAGEDATITLYSPHWNDLYPAAWQSGDNYVVAFEPVVLKAALKNTSHLHVDILVPEYLRMIAQLQPDDSFAGKVKTILLSMSNPQLPNIQEVSEALYLTPRTLQRRLGAEGVTFREVLEGIKKQICALLLRHDRYSIAGISTILGYAEPAAFIHSFKKWYGDSPDRMRKLMNG